MSQAGLSVNLVAQFGPPLEGRQPGCLTAGTENEVSGLKKRKGACLNAKSSITRSQSPWQNAANIRKCAAGTCIFEDYSESGLLSATPEQRKDLILSGGSARKEQMLQFCCGRLK
jgi:hypothetical protein